MVVIGTEVKFEAAHRQYGDSGKCGFLHGHNWKVDIQLEGWADKVGYIVDFKVIKDIINQFDHTVILCENDPLVNVLLNAGQKVFVIDENPSCEQLSKIITGEMIDQFGGQLKKVSVVVWENDISFARYTKRVQK